MPLRVVIAGAGIAGLSAAIGFARYGHKVIVLERRALDEPEQSGSSIQMQPNGVKILKAWGLMAELRKVAQNSECAELREAGVKKPFAVEDLNIRGGAYLASRNDMRDFFEASAMKAGAEIRYDARVAKVDPSGPTVFFEDGSILNADFVIGADGAYSRVRQSLFPNIQPSILSSCYFQITVPLDFVEAHPETRDLVNGPHNIIICSPGRSIFSSSVLSRGVFDMQLADENYSFDIDPHPNIRNERISDLSWLRSRFADHGEGLKMVLDKAESCWKWRLNEVTGLTSWSSENAKVVLIGDACHSMRPNAGQGSAMGLEDGAMLSEIFAYASPGDNFRSIIRQFEKHRIHRCNKMQRFAAVSGRSWAVEDPDQIQERNQKLAQSVGGHYEGIEADAEATFGSQAFRKWIDHYDVFEESRKLLESRSRRLARI